MSQEQIPLVMSPAIASQYADFFQGRILNGFLSLGYGIGFADTIKDQQGQDVSVYHTEINGRLVMTLKAAERLEDVLQKLIAQAKADHK